MPVKWETAFNALTILVSLLDIISDVYITYLFWLHAQYTYFYISISILILTQLSYCGLFVYLFRFNYNSFITIACIIIFIVIPISPCLPFIFYFSAQHDNEFSKYLLKLLKIRHSDFNNDAIKANKAQIYQQRDPTRRFIENHFKKHIGFICESMSESFCQLLLQLFIVINLTVTPSAANETYFIRYLSILLSLLSIILSLYIFCHSIYFKLFIFNYLCIIADVVKFLTCVTCITYNHSFFNFIWIYKLLFITSIAALYISIQFISNKIDLNYNWNHIKTNFGRKRSISLSHSKSKSKSNASNKSNVSNKSNTNSSRYSNNLSTYHISSSLNRSKDNKLKEFIQIFISSNVCIEIIFFILFTCLVLILWPFIILCLEVFSFSLIALMINKFNTSRFLSIHWNLWEYVFNFLLSNKSMVMHDTPCTPSTALTAVTAGRSYTPSRSYHEQIIQSGDDSIHSDDYGYDSCDGTTGDNTQLDATQLEVKLNTIANAGYKTRGDRKKKKYNQRLWIKERDIPWERDKDLLMRLCVINYILSQHRQSKKLYNYLEMSLQRCFFNDVSLKELRFYSCNGFNIFKYHHLNIIEKWYATTKYSKSKTNAKKCCFFKWKKFELALKWIMFFIILPLYFVSQLLFILYPFILFVYSFIDIVILKYIFIILYTLFIFALLCMGPSIYRFTKITSHIHYNSILYFTSYNSSFPNVEKKMIEDIHDLYINLVATQIRFDLLNNIFGKAICNLLLSYLPSFHVVYHENNYKDESSYKELENNNNKSVSVNVMAQLNVFDENWTNIDRNDENEEKSLQHQKINISITPAKTGDDMKHNKHTNNNKQTSLLTTSSNISDVSNDTDISDDTTNL